RSVTQYIDEDVGIAGELHARSTFVEEVLEPTRSLQGPHGVDKAMAKRDFIERSVDGLGLGACLQNTLGLVELLLVHQHVLSDPSRRFARCAHLSAGGTAARDNCSRHGQSVSLYELYH